MSGSGRSRRLPVVRRLEGQAKKLRDHVASEEPLEIALRGPGGETVSLAVTMRTPGNDYELTAGFLMSEGLIRSPRQLKRLAYCGKQHNYNRVQAWLEELPDPASYARRSYITSSCGICGKASLELVEQACLSPPAPLTELSARWLRELPGRLSEGQDLFALTGGLHASALFRAHGECLLTREDVGRHNALDKLLGRLFLDGGLPAGNSLLLLSGRASFELIQKAVMGGIPAVAALGAPSSLAVELAQRFQLILIGFLRADRFNIYAGEDRVRD